MQGLGTAGGFKLLVQDRGGRGLAALQQATDELIAAARREPALAGVFSTFRASTPQLYADIDRVKAEKLDVPLANIFDTLQVYLGSVYVNDFNRFGRTFQVRAQAEGDYRAEAADIAAPEDAQRERRHGAARLGARRAVEERRRPRRALQHVPGGRGPGRRRAGRQLGRRDRDHGAARGDQSSRPGWRSSGPTSPTSRSSPATRRFFIFPLCVLFVFLVHSAEYESWSLPLAIILIAPMCLPFALLGVWLRGMDNNLITQIGFVVLIGLAAKNAVLIVEFAKQQQEEGKDRFAAAVEACRLRLRPILMTVVRLHPRRPAARARRRVRAPRCARRSARPSSAACSASPSSASS